MDTVSGTDVRPPVATHPAPTPDTAIRPSAVLRPLVIPRLLPLSGGVLPADPYVRRYWTALLGPTAVEELLRLIVAAERATAIPLPHRLAQLATEGLVTLTRRQIWVRPRVPRLGPRQIRRLPPGLRAEHARLHSR